MKMEIGEWHKIRLPMWRYEPTYHFSDAKRDVLIDFDALVVGFFDQKIAVHVPHSYTYFVDEKDIIS